MKQRIHTLKKDEILKQQFEYYGLSHLLSDVKFSVMPGQNIYEQMGKFESAVKRKVKGIFMGLNVQKKLEFIEDISLGPYNLKVELLTKFETETEKTILELLYRGANLINKDNVIEKYQPAKITISYKGKLDVAYTFLNSTLKPKYHMRYWGLKSNCKKIGHFLFADCIKILTKTISINSLTKFTENQGDYIRFKIAEYYSQRSIKMNLTILPEDKRLAEMVTREIYKNKLPFIDCESSLVDNYYTYEDFSLQKNEGTPHILCTKQGKEIIIPRFIRSMFIARTKAERLLEEHSTYAKAFQDKKYVSGKVLSVMEKNDFLTHYGKVELDNDVDLVRFNSLELEFNDLKNKIYIPKASDYSFRIRKLGQHRAAGLHYSSFRATIIDIEHPNAYIHELGHQIDHTMIRNKIMSESLDFLGIIEIYEKLTEESVKHLPNEDPFKQTWNGTSKYNRSYYFQPTEVFARAYELYIFKCLQIESSFLKENYDSPVYPSEKTFLNLIQSYFNNLFFKFVSGNKVETSHNNATEEIENKHFKEKEYEYRNNEQIYLF
ncbi:LPD1 domain-containing protein [Paenibacillus polymyxa]|uniref:LPD1 domain-containing protein n=1 Tax=Paenibacillus polymyxa TaxID=1406 RepID=UPI0032178AD0